MGKKKLPFPRASRKEPCNLMSKWYSSPGCDSIRETNHEVGCINLFIPFGNKSHIIIDIYILTGNRLCTPGIRPGEFVMLGWGICHHMEWRVLADSNWMHQHHHEFLK